MASRHLDFTFEDGLGLLIFPRTHATALVDGQEITSRTRSKDYPMHHGSRLTVGDAVLRLRLFVGLETAHPTAAAQPEEPPEIPAEEAPPAAMDWQNMPYIYHQIPAAWVDRRDSTSPFKWPERASIHRRAFPGRIPCRRLRSACLWKSTLWRAMPTRLIPVTPRCSRRMMPHRK